MGKKSEQTKVADQMNNQDAIDVEIEQDSAAITIIEGETLPTDWQFNNFETISSVIWRPEPGWALMGTYQGRQRFDEGEFDAVCCLHTIKDFKTNMPVTFVGGTMLDKFIIDGKVGPGTRLIVRRLDMSETKKGRHVNNWDIRIDPSTTNPTYNPPVDAEIKEFKSSKKG